MSHIQHSDSLVVDREETMIGSYGPQKDPHVVVIPKSGWDEAPKGVIARGKYKAISKVTLISSKKTKQTSFDIKSLWMMTAKFIWNMNMHLVHNPFFFKCLF